MGRIVILHKYPFSIVEYCAFRECNKNLQPLFKMASRRTISNDFLKFFEDEKEMLFGVMEKLQCRINLTSDLWTSIKINPTLPLPATILIIIGD